MCLPVCQLVCLWGWRTVCAGVCERENVSIACFGIVCLLCQWSWLNWVEFRERERERKSRWRIKCECRTQWCLWQAFFFFFYREAIVSRARVCEWKWKSGVTESRGKQSECLSVIVANSSDKLVKKWRFFFKVRLVSVIWLLWIVVRKTHLYSICLLDSSSSHWEDAKLPGLHPIPTTERYTKCKLFCRKTKLSRLRCFLEICGKLFGQLIAMRPRPILSKMTNKAFWNWYYMALTCLDPAKNVFATRYQILHIASELLSRSKSQCCHLAAPHQAWHRYHIIFSRYQCICVNRNLFLNTAWCKHVFFFQECFWKCGVSKKKSVSV